VIEVSIQGCWHSGVVWDTRTCRHQRSSSSQLTAVRQGSFGGHPWPWLPINVPRCQMANLHSFAVTGPGGCDVLPSLMSSDFVLVAGPLVRASSWEPTAKHLREAGCCVQVPDILAHRASPPAWSAWTQDLLRHITSSRGLIVVGHSSASILAADLATKLLARSVIVVDGEVPPSHGAASPVRPALRDLVESLAEADGSLPIWSRWFSGDARRMSLVGLDVLARDPAAFTHFENELPKMHAEWFDDTIALANWDHIPAGYIQTSAIYDHAAAEAERRGWPVTRLQGTHLHPTLHPQETADAILAMSRWIVSSSLDP